MKSRTFLAIRARLRRPFSPQYLHQRPPTFCRCTSSSAVGIAAGYALITGKPSIVSLHTYPGLANGMFNMRNALMAGVPLLVINGQQDLRFLIHNPVLGAPNTQLAETATKYSYEVTSIDDLTVALQRCYLQARLQPTGPTFLSIPMNFMLWMLAAYAGTRVSSSPRP